MSGGSRILVGLWVTHTLFMLHCFTDAQQFCLKENQWVHHAGVFWKIISEHKVKSLFTVPTAIRAIKKEDSNGDFFKKISQI